MSFFQALRNTIRFVANHPLNRGRRLRAVAHFAAWQLRVRLTRAPIVHEWVNGARILAGVGETGVTGNIYGGLHEFEDMAFVLHALGPESLFVDAGANVGSYTVLACAAKGARGVSIEPVPATFERLMANIRLNRLEDRVQALNCGLSDAGGELRLTANENCTNHVVRDGESAAETVRVPVRTLDDVLRGESPTVLKVDVEGFEGSVLAGAGETLRNASLQAVILELNGAGARYGFDDDEIVNTMRDAGFSPCAYQPFSRTLTNLGGKNPDSANTLFVRDVDAMRARLKGAPVVEVHGVAL